MAKRKQVTKKQRSELKVAMEGSAKARDNFLVGIVGSRQEPEQPLFDHSTIQAHKLLKPPYDPVKMYKVCESSGILPQCIDAMKLNADGFGYELKYAGAPEEVESDAVKKEKENLTAFFNKVNESSSFSTVRMSVRADLEATGNGYIEVIRARDKSIIALYYMDAKRVRLQALQQDSIDVKIKLWRNGKERSIPMKRKFRRYAQLISTSTTKLKWFKQFGDPRRMCSISGMYEDSLKEDQKVKEEASEIIHFKIGNATYGVPRWTGQALNLLGMNSADYVNWDLFENQVVPPLVITVSGGTLTSESIKDIKTILLQKRGVENFNKVLILEAQAEGNITDKSSTKIDLKEMSVARKEDAMFVEYSEKGEHRVRSSFRLPPLYVGRADSYSKSTADSSKMIAEEQIFVPERTAFDEVVNVLIMPELKAKYWLFSSKGPRLITGPEVVTGFKEFSKFGVFSINEGIRLANRTLNMDITEYKEAWANYPIPIVLELAKMGLLKEIEEISSMAGELADLINASGADDAASAAKLYSFLSTLRGTLIDIAINREEEEKEVKGLLQREEEEVKELLQ